MKCNVKVVSAILPLSPLISAVHAHVYTISGVSSSLIHGGAMVTDPLHYPWFAFIKIGMPDIQWRIYDPKTGTTA